jgi:hypothetical protein
VGMMASSLATRASISGLLKVRLGLVVYRLIFQKVLLS